MKYCTKKRCPMQVGSVPENCYREECPYLTLPAEFQNVSDDGNGLLKEWQHRLGLDDWFIKLVDKCSPQTMTLAICSGCTEWDEVNKAARIEIVDPMYYGERVKPFDYEKTLVHELLHIKTSFVSDGVDDLQGRIMHQMIDDLARALVDAKRYDCGAKMDGE